MPGSPLAGFRRLVLASSALALPVLAGVFVAPSASALGILPPSNPAASIPAPASMISACYGGGTATSCQTAAIAAIDAARAREGVGPLLLPSNYNSLTAAEQLFVLVDLERVARDVAPIAGMTPVLDNEAQAGAAGHTDPTGPNGATWDSTVAVGEASALTTDYDWMYNDGPGSANAACPPDCWGHRDAILGNGELMGAGSSGSAYATVVASGYSESTVFSWTQEQPYAGGHAYWQVGTNGEVYNFGNAGFLGTTSVGRLNRPVVDMASDPAGGYWLVASDGGVFTFAGAPYYGSTGNIHLNAPIVGIASTPDGGGYWLVASDGGVFTFGDAKYHGSTGNIHLNAPIVGIASTPDGGGYRLVASDGGVFTFGDATFDGSPAALRLNAPVTSIVDDPATGGYWLMASDGGVFNYDAPLFGSMGGIHLSAPIVGASAS